MSFLFYCTSGSGLPEAVSGGVRDAVVFASLQSARLTGSSHILVVDAERVKGLQLHDSTTGNVSMVPRRAILNVQPYLRPRTVIAAGGIVLDEDGTHVLLIRRHGLWDLPKGKREQRETTPACALREVCEETGASQLVLHQFLGTTLHGYARSGRYCVKESYWYLMQSSERAFVPAREEGIDAVQWTARAVAADCIGYPALGRFLRAVDPWLVSG